MKFIHLFRAEIKNLLQWKLQKISTNFSLKKDKSIKLLTRPTRKNNQQNNK